MPGSWASVFFLAAIALSESIRRLPGDTLLLRRLGWKPWRCAPDGVADQARLVSWCIPLDLPMILHPDSGTTRLGLRRALTRFRARMRRVEPDVAVLRGIGLGSLGLLLFLPVAMSWWGLWGLLSSVELLFMLTLGQTTIAWSALARSGMTRRAAAGASLKFLWPFTSQRAAEAVMAQVASGVPTLMVARELLGDAEFLRAFRRLAYDTVKGDLRGDNGRLIEAMFSRPLLEAAILMGPAGAIEPWCPRCLTLYQTGTATCADCDITLQRPGLAQA